MPPGWEPEAGDASGLIYDAPNSLSELQDVTLQAGVLVVDQENAVTALGGTINNAGTLVVTTSGELATDGPVTLAGGGTLQVYGVVLPGSELSNSDFLLHLTPGPDTLTNVGNTIIGAGNIAVDVINEAGGVIAGQNDEGIVLQGGFTNSGLIEAITGGVVHLEGVGNDNTHGLIKADGGEIRVFSSVVTGGVFSTTASGLVTLQIGAVLDGVTMEGAGAYRGVSGGIDAPNELADVTIQAGATFTAESGDETGLRGTIDNAGRIVGSFTDIGGGNWVEGVLVADGPVTLTGGGVLEVDSALIVTAGSDPDHFFTASGPDTLTNVNNTIIGAGNIAVEVINEAGGVIAGQNDQGLVVDGDLTNEGLAEAITGGALHLDGAVTNDGTIEVSGGGRVMISGPLTGSGSIQLGSGVISLGEAGAGQTINFVGGGTLDLSSASLDASQAFDPAINWFAVGDTIALEGVATGVTFVGGLLTLTNGSGVVGEFHLSGSYLDPVFSTDIVNGVTQLQLVTAARSLDSFNLDLRSDFLIQNRAGVVVVGEDRGGSAAYSAVTDLGSEWVFKGNGDFLGDGKEGFLIQNTAGTVYVSEVSGGGVAFSQVAALGSEWSFKGAGDLLGEGQDQFLIENNAGAVYVGEVKSGSAVYTGVSALGSEWSFHGIGDFNGDGQDDYLIQNQAGVVAIGEVKSGSAVYAAVTDLGSEWKFVGVGDFLGDGKSDFLIQNTAGQVDFGEVANGAASFTAITQLGSEWKFVATGDYLGEGHDQFLIENSSGAVVIGDWTGGAIHFTQVAGLGPEWAFH